MAITSPASQRMIGSKLPITEVLYEYDGPMVFICQFGMFYTIFSRIDEFEDSHIYAAGTVNSKILESLKQGRLSLRGALLCEPCFLVTTTDLVVSNIDERSKTDMPLELLPTPGRAIVQGITDAVDVFEQLDSFFSIRFSGGDLSSKSIPFSYFKHLMDSVYESARKIMMPSGFKNAKSATFDFDILEPSFGSLVINLQNPVIDETNAKRHLNNKNIKIESIYANSYQKREEFFNNLENLVEDAESDSIDKFKAELNIELLKQINSLIPREDAIFTKVEFNAKIGDEFRQIVVGEDAAIRLGRAHDAALGEDGIAVGKITIINSKQRTFVVERDIGKEVTCAVREKEFLDLEANAEFKGGARVIVEGRIYQRSRRDYMVSDSIDLIEGIFS